LVTCGRAWATQCPGRQDTPSDATAAGAPEEITLLSARFAALARSSACRCLRCVSAVCIRVWCVSMCGVYSCTVQSGVCGVNGVRQVSGRRQGGSKPKGKGSRHAGWPGAGQRYRQRHLRWRFCFCKDGRAAADVSFRLPRCSCSLRGKSTVVEEMYAYVCRQMRRCEEFSVGQWLVGHHRVADVGSSRRRCGGALQAPYRLLCACSSNRWPSVSSVSDSSLPLPRPAMLACCRMGAVGVRSVGRLVRATLWMGHRVTCGPLSHFQAVGHVGVESTRLPFWPPRHSLPLLSHPSPSPPPPTTHPSIYLPTPCTLCTHTHTHNRLGTVPG